jgi:LCP family protein required for cell wall assembly
MPMDGDGWWEPEAARDPRAPRQQPRSAARPGRPGPRQSEEAWLPSAPNDFPEQTPHGGERRHPGGPGQAEATRAQPRAGVAGPRRSRRAAVPSQGSRIEGRINADLDLDEIDPKGRARKRAAKQSARRTGPARKGLRYAAMSMAGVMLAVAGFGAYLYIHFDGNITSSALLPDGASQAAEIPNKFGQTPMNILLLGNGGRVNAEDCKLAGACSDTSTAADTLMVVHLAADRSNMTVMSIPRDTIVSLPACAKETRDLINASLNNGPACAVETVHQVTGLTIDHFIEIDMSGVVTMSNALGGVPVCVTNNLYDSYSHLKLPKGTSVLQGTQALAWLRTRHAFINEVYREQAQHMFMAALVRKLKDNASFTHITTLYGVADAATKALTVDDGLGSVTDLLSLAQEIGKVPTNRTTFLSAPTEQYSGSNSAWSQQLQLTEPSARNMFTALANDQPYTAGGGSSSSSSNGKATAGATSSASATDQAVNTAMVRAQIKNASGASGRASAIRGALVSQGFSSSELTVGTASQPSSTTALYYPADRAQSAQAVATALKIPSTAMHQSSNYSEVTVVIGSDWASGTTYGAANTGTGTGTTATTTAPTTVASSPPSSSLETNGADSKSCMDVPRPEW